MTFSITVTPVLHSNASDNSRGVATRDSKRKSGRFVRGGGVEGGGEDGSEVMSCQVRRFRASTRTRHKVLADRTLVASDKLLGIS